MTPTPSSVRRATLAAALAFGLASAAPAEAAGPRAPDDAGAAHPRARSLHRHGTVAPRGRGFADRHGHRHARFVAADPDPLFEATGLPAGYASDESPFNVQAEDDAFDTGAFYGCLHTVLTAGGYRPVATCD